MQLNVLLNLSFCLVFHLQVKQKKFEVIDRHQVLHFFFSVVEDVV